MVTRHTAGGRARRRALADAAAGLPAPSPTYPPAPHPRDGEQRREAAGTS